MASFEVVEKVGNDLHCRCTDPGLLLPHAKLSFWRAGETSWEEYWATYLINKGQFPHLHEIIRFLLIKSRFSFLLHK